MENLTIEDVECLISWPKGTMGYKDEREALKVLIELCNHHGYGRIPQLADNMEKLWRNPDTKSIFDFQRRRNLQEIYNVQEEE